MNVTITKAFERDLKRLDKPAQIAAVGAIRSFMANPKATKLNFEQVRSRAGYCTIRADYSIRILLRQDGPHDFDAVAIGNHDYVYKSYFKK